MAPGYLKAAIGGTWLPKSGNSWHLVTEGRQQVALGFRRAASGTDGAPWVAYVGRMDSLVGLPVGVGRRGSDGRIGGERHEDEIEGDEMNDHPKQNHFIASDARRDFLRKGQLWGHPGPSESNH